MVLIVVRQTKTHRQASINANNPISLVSSFGGSGGRGTISTGDNVRNVANRWLAGFGVGG